MESGYKIGVLMHMDLGKAQMLILHYEVRLLVELILEISVLVLYSSSIKSSQSLCKLC